MENFTELSARLSLSANSDTSTVNPYGTGQRITAQQVLYLLAPGVKMKNR